MRRVIGAIVGIIGIGIGIYLGLYVMFIGGITQAIEAVQEDPIPASELAWGIARIVFASLSASVTIFLSIVLGIAIADE